VICFPINIVVEVAMATETTN